MTFDSSNNNNNDNSGCFRVSASGNRRSFLAAALLMVATVALDQTIGSYYDMRLLLAGTAISTTSAAALLAWFSHRFFVWYRSNRKHVIILVLGIAEAIIALAAAGNMVSIASMLSEGIRG